MSHSFKLSRRIARFRALLFAALVLALPSCDKADAFNPSGDPEVTDQGSTIDPGSTSTEDASVEELQSAPELSLSSVSFSGGIPIGTTNQPNTAFGSIYNGAVRVIWPEYLLSNLAAVKSRGGKVIVSMTGGPKNYRDAAGNFSLTKWKARVDQYRRLNFSSYISDGTIIGHYLIDEPSDKSNWNGKQVSQATVEAMAKYSKQYWPGLVTIVRDKPSWLAAYSGTYQYLDAGWAQYHSARGPVSTFLSSNVSAAKSKGLALVVGLNILDGHGTNTAPMTASEIKSWGSALLSSSYPCAFVSWRYESTYLARSDIKSAMGYLRDKAENHSTKSCRGS